MRFQAGESDLISRVNAKNFAVLQQDQPQRGYDLQSLGASLEYNFLFFNLNDLSGKPMPQVASRQKFFQSLSFRKAVSLAIDRDAIVRLVYLGHATPLAGPVSPANQAWVNGSLPSRHAPWRRRAICWSPAVSRIRRMARCLTRTATRWSSPSLPAREMRIACRWLRSFRTI